jgi:hypothetical protein
MVAHVTEINVRVLMLYIAYKAGMNSGVMINPKNPIWIDDLSFFNKFIHECQSIIKLE